MSFILKLTTIFSLCGVALAQNNNAILTFDEAKQLADQGDAFGEAVAAFHYSIGWQTEKNLEQAVKYAKSSAEKKNPLGLFRLGSFTLSGEGLEKNEEVGLALQDEALTGLNEMEGNPYSITALGVVLFQGKVLDQDQATAAKLYKKAADMGYAPAQYNYAKCAESGQGIAKNIAASKMYLQKAAAQNYPLALFGKQESAKSDTPAASKNYKTLDADLNAVYKELRSLLAPANQKKLKDWQMKWVQKNESTAKNESDSGEKDRLLLEATKTRLAELEELLSEIKIDADRELDFEEDGQARHHNANGLNDLLMSDFPEESLRLTLGITLPPGISYSGRDIRGMWPELRYRSTETNKKLLVCTFSEPQEGNTVEGSQTWHEGYYLSPDGAVAIIQAMDEEAFHSDGVNGQTCYYVYHLPALADVLRTAPRGSNTKDFNLKPVQSLTKAQLAAAFPDVAAPKEANAQAVESQGKATDTGGSKPHTKIARSDDTTASDTKVNEKDILSPELKELPQVLKTANVKISSGFKEIKNQFNRIINQPKTVKSTAKLQEIANFLDQQCDQLFSQIISKKEELFKQVDPFPALAQEVKIQFSKLDSLYSQMEELSIVIKEDYLTPADGSSE